jgi:uncharacterized protein YndB with AHSA1/START domain
MASKPQFVTKRRFAAHPSTVFAAWTTPEHIARWWGPNIGDTSRAEIDLRVGGRFTVLTDAADGDQHQVSGIYREVTPNRKLVFTWAWRSTPERESLVTIDIEPEGDGTLLTLTHEQLFDDAARDRHETGWRTALDKLERLVTR